MTQRFLSATYLVVPEAGLTGFGEFVVEWTASGAGGSLVTSTIQPAMKLYYGGFPVEGSIEIAHSGVRWHRAPFADFFIARTPASLFIPRSDIRSARQISGPLEWIFFGRMGICEVETRLGRVRFANQLSADRIAESISRLAH